MKRTPWIDPETAYIHVPFCAHHCGYCDFAVTVGQDHQIELYLEALAVELASLAQPYPVQTLFIGGGTPTHLSAAQLDGLLALLQRWLPWPRGNEASIEATPESLSVEKCAVLAARGITRVSLGVQSFDTRTLAALDRRHRSDQIGVALCYIRDAGLTASLDLIYAAPGSTLADWQADVAQALKFEPEHLSAYGLTYEKGTPLWKQRQRGAVRVVPELEELAMYEWTLDALAAHGYEHYEVSNFAKPGHRCGHNERYWANEAYHGYGTGAARYVGSSRELNVRNTADYIRRTLGGESPTFQREILSPHERALETAAVQLRRGRGIEFHPFEQQTGYSAVELFRLAMPVLLGEALVHRSDTGLSLTRKGYCVADGVVEHLLSRATPA